MIEMENLKFYAKNKFTNEICEVLLICFVNRYVDVLPKNNIENGNQESWKFDDIKICVKNN